MEDDNRFAVQFEGGHGVASHACRKLLGAHRLPSGEWMDVSITSRGEDIKLFIDPDRNPQQVLKGILAFKRAKLVEERTGKQAFANKDSGVVRADWLPLSKVKPASRTGCKFWNWETNCSKPGLDCEEIRATLMEQVQKDGDKDAKVL